MRLSSNFMLNEFIESETAIRLNIDNKPNDSQLNHIKKLVNNILQPLRNWYGKPINITSGFRSDHLNLIIGGAKYSDHKEGLAADFKCEDMYRCFLYIKDNLEFDQLIWEFGNCDQPAWIHVSVNKKNRKQVLQAKRDDNGKTRYLIYGY